MPKMRGSHFTAGRPASGSAVRRDSRSLPFSGRCSSTMTPWPCFASASCAWSSVKAARRLAGSREIEHRERLVHAHQRLDVAAISPPMTSARCVGTTDTVGEGVQREVAVCGRHRLRDDALDQRFRLGAVMDEVGDGADLQPVLAAEGDQLGQSGHGAVVVHDLRRSPPPVRARSARRGRSRPRCGRRTSTPPFCAISGKMWPGWTMSCCVAFFATAACTVRARSAAEMPVVTPSAALDRER